MDHTTERQPGLSQANIPIGVDLDLEAAWTCVRDDWTWQWFEPFYPEFAQIVDADPEGWFEHLRSRIRTGDYRIDPLIGDTPFSSPISLKKRMPLYAQPGDQVLFSAATIACTSALLRAGINHDAVCGPVFFCNDTGTQWPTDPNFWFQMFVGRTRARMEDGATHVAVTDISNFFGSIEHQTLHTQLISAGAPPEHADLIRRMLGYWFPQGYGVPWARASHVLSSCYVLPIDRALRANGIRFLRLVDDYRFFCDSQAQAEDALALLNDEFAKLGLARNEAKTRIFNDNGFEINTALLPLHRLAARRLAGAISTAERLGATVVAKRLRRTAGRYLRDAYRRYLGRLLAETPDLDCYLVGLVTGEIPGAYLEFAAFELGNRERAHVGTQALSTLASIALSSEAPNHMASIARKLLVLIGRKQTVSLDAWLDNRPDSYPRSGGEREPHNAFAELEELLFARLLPEADRRRLLSRLQPRSYLSKRALEHERQA